MVAYNFQPQFVRPIAEHRKISTMRRERQARHVAPGASFRLYTGQRTKACRLLGFATCRKLERVRLNLKDGLADVEYPRNITPRWGDLDVDRLAREEGFESFDELRAFWAKHHRERWSWEGWRVTWGTTFQPPPTFMAAP